ncbi:MAG: hypothetical protein J1F32_01825 [Erysipelotrichales bacterium]|nr:hypothetical protein [Erysipelotrichales bacterium]
MFNNFKNNYSKKPNHLYYPNEWYVKELKSTLNHMGTCMSGVKVVEEKSGCSFIKNGKKVNVLFTPKKEDHKLFVSKGKNGSNNIWVDGKSVKMYSGIQDVIFNFFNKR